MSRLRFFVIGIASIALAAMAFYGAPVKDSEASACVSATRITVVNGQFVIQDQTTGDCESSSSTTVETTSVNESDGTSFKVVEKTTVQASKRLTKAEIINVISR